MIITKLNGGLGNQLFQYAAGRSLADHHNTELILDLEWFKNAPVGNTRRKFELGKYPIIARVASPKEVAAFTFYHGRVLRRIPFLPRLWKYQREKHFQYDPCFFNFANNCYLDGYWQSHLYFDDIGGSLRAQLQPNIEPGPANQKLLDEIAIENSVAVHIRRGDYLTNPSASSHHGVCSLDYYQQAVEQITSKVANPHFYVFSDDLAWARENLIFHFPVTFVGHNLAEQSFQDLHLMSHCKHQIIANSSFSWWGAWLNSNPEKIVIHPKRWFLVNKDTSTLFPSTWLGI
ncbi:alpha-1,2-fucosyltransferase [Polynucleobacter sp. JS-JIR-II-b4]|jgi:hypothetical protein|uniref:alpha-1,2-fucosyltransferase n=1 Tax=Polynucleobacter sp. JS-JIR-II-b4 TaxID=1758390 RepID=UPI001BFD894A|nr:alpha-1,2-fucosyltransferase [Polynucleobacter sp. JS-JIR-II-b4]QWE02827.1 alpha-1,2-fucosyltransferase [Polynucleobacter sp. JS-JIR-II-b4]